MEDLGTILIVDDNPANLEVLGALLSSAGYRVRPALSGEVALRALEVVQPDLILLDVRMPGMDGYETCRRIKSKEVSRGIPVIFISAMHDVEDKLNGFRAGGVDYVAKPFQAEEVLARVQAHVQLHRIQNQLEDMVETRTRALRESETQYKVLFDTSPVSILVFDAVNLRVLAANAAFTRLLGYGTEQALGCSLDAFSPPEKQAELRALVRTQSPHTQEAAFIRPLQLCRLDGNLLDVEGVLQRIDYAGKPAQVLLLQDVTSARRTEELLQRSAKEHQQQLEQLAHYDSLTGLPNRTLFIQRTLQGLEQAHSTGCWLVVCYLDIDAFGALNTLHGQEACDHILINTAECLRSCLHGGDTLARTSGDEFALLVMGIRSESELESFLGRLQARLAEPFVTDEWSATLSVGIGITIYPQDDSDPETLLRHADQAMLAAKQGGKGRSQRYDPEQDKRTRAHQESVEHMRAALRLKEFILYYQPKINMSSGQVVGAEALIRWQHPERGLLPPGAFLPQIETDPFMLELGDWVISEALRQMALWRAQGLDLTISVNVSAQQFLQENFLLRLRELLAAHAGTPPGRLELEVLETSSIDDLDKVEALISECRALGVGFSLDDFGTGYSSLTYLRRLSADTLKIDQSFVRGMLEDAEDQAIVAGVIGLANAFRRKVIAEGVETLAHGRLLLSLGCVLAQGYGVARPMPAQDLPGWVLSWPDAAWLEIAGERHEA